MAARDELLAAVADRYARRADNRVSNPGGPGLENRFYRDWTPSPGRRSDRMLILVVLPSSRFDRAVRSYSSHAAIRRLVRFPVIVQPGKKSPSGRAAPPPSADTALHFDPKPMRGSPAGMPVATADGQPITKRQKVFDERRDARLVCHELRSLCPRNSEVINIEAAQDENFTA